MINEFDILLGLMEMCNGAILLLLTPLVKLFCDVDDNSKIIFAFYRIIHILYKEQFHAWPVNSTQGGYARVKKLLV